MADRREQLIELAGRIARLREELEAATDRFDSLLAKGQPPASGNRGNQEKKTAAVDGHRIVAGSLSDRILQLLQASPGKKFGINAIMGVADKSSIQTVRSAVWRLVNQERIDKAGRGKYRAPAKEGAGNTA